MIDWPDFVNGLIQLVGACFTWRNALQLRRDGQIVGVYWPTTIFFTLVGAWNLVYYPALNQWFSLFGAALLVSGNLAWAIGALRIFYSQGIDEIFLANPDPKGQDNGS